MGRKRIAIHQKRKKRPSASKNQTAGRRRLQKAGKKNSTDLNIELRRCPGAQQMEPSPLVDWEGWQEHSNRRKETGKVSSPASPTGKTKRTRKSELKTMRSIGERALHGLAPNWTDLPPKRANSASVRRRKTGRKFVFFSGTSLRASAHGRVRTRLTFRSFFFVVVAVAVSLLSRRMALPGVES